MTTLNEYQNEAGQTASYPTEPPIMALLYPALGLAGESGEVVDKIKKILRDHGSNIDPESKDALVLELGDVLWYIATIATVLGVTLEEVAQRNVDKLLSRQRRGKIGGDGDDR